MKIAFGIVDRTSLKEDRKSLPLIGAFDSRLSVLQPRDRRLVHPLAISLCILHYFRCV